MSLGYQSGQWDVSTRWHPPQRTIGSCGVYWIGEVNGVGDEVFIIGFGQHFTHSLLHFRPKPAKERK
jgi:hypothetical protein